MKLQAVGNSVLVEPETPKTATDSGILIAEQKFGSAPKVGRILSIGPRVEDFDYAIGDRVAIAVELGDVHGGVIDGQRMLKLKPEQIIGQVTEGAVIE